MSLALLTRELAATFLAGDLSVAALVQRGARLLGKKWRWLRPLATRFCATFPKQRPRLRVAAMFLARDPNFCRACELHELEVVELSLRPSMWPIDAARQWNLPQLGTTGELAAWLRVSCRELEWFADWRGLNRKTPSQPLQHYSYRPVSKRFGQVRLIEAPKERLKALQRQLLIEILEPIPLPDVVHGFRTERSIQTFAAPHVGQAVVLKIDLQDFFPSLAAARVSALFRSLGYPETVADLLTGLCTTITPNEAWDPIEDLPRAERWRLESLYGRRHLPQGAPTSPALANLCAYRLDRRLSALASRAGGRYTRYADDLAFSGDANFVRGIDRFHLAACAIALEEGFAVQHRKTRIMRPSVRQQLAGLVVNERLNLRRADFDELKAILTNCVRHGVASQNRAGHPDFRAHLRGRISFVAQIHPQRGARLLELFERIAW